MSIRESTSIELPSAVSGSNELISCPAFTRMVPTCAAAASSDDCAIATLTVQIKAQTLDRELFQLRARGRDAQAQHAGDIGIGVKKIKLRLGLKARRHNFERPKRNRITGAEAAVEPDLLDLRGGLGENAEIGRPVLRRVPTEEAPAYVERLVAAYLAERAEGESFQSFAKRLRTLITSSWKNPIASSATIPSRVWPSSITQAIAHKSSWIAVAFRFWWNPARYIGRLECARSGLILTRANPARSALVVAGFGGIARSTL